MNRLQIDGKNVVFEPFDLNRKENLLLYFNKLSNQSKKRYGPHPFTLDAIIETHKDALNHKMFVARETESNAIVAYTVVKMGWVHFDHNRLVAYGLSIAPKDATIAPSVADEWQSKGLGSKFLSYVIDYLKTEFGITRLILWGGVQSDNEKAIRLYRKFNFRLLGEFEHNGMNKDMILNLQ